MDESNGELEQATGHAEEVEEEEQQLSLGFYPVLPKSTRLPTIGFIQPVKDHDQESS